MVFILLSELGLIAICGQIKMLKTANYPFLNQRKLCFRHFIQVFELEPDIRFL